MRPTPSILLAAVLSAVVAAPVRAADAVEPAALLARLRVTYSQPTSFTPAAMRFPLRADVLADLTRARQTRATLEERAQYARLAEQANDPSAEQEWSEVLTGAEAALKKSPQDVRLLELTVEAMVGADAAVRAVPAAAKLAAAQPSAWRTHLLVGDAHFRRADHHWRVLIQLGRANAMLPPERVLELKADLKAAERAYLRAAAMSPTEPSPRAGKIALQLARPVMAALLPTGVLDSATAPDLGSIRRELVDLVRATPGRVEPLWHATHFLATQPTDDEALSAEERRVIQDSLTAAQAGAEAKLFVAEAGAMFALARRDWAAARTAFEEALKLAPKRQWSADWLAMAEANSPEPPSQILARLEPRLQMQPRACDWVLRGVLLARDNRKAAIESLRKAIALDIDSASARYNLAVLLLRDDPDSIEGRHHLQRSLEARPDDRDAQFGYLVIQGLDGNPIEARAALQQLALRPDLDADLRKRLEETIKDLTPPKP
jgi:tetratricopeptide (TPR) repeat protein